MPIPADFDGADALDIDLADAADNVEAPALLTGAEWAALAERTVERQWERHLPNP